MAEFHDLAELALNDAGQSWGNLGFWQGESTYSESCRKLALLIGNALELDNTTSVFDAGFGCGDQLLLWLQHYLVSDLRGVNLSSCQTKVAKQLLEDSGFAGTAENIYSEDVNVDSVWQNLGIHSIDRVLALDSAYHFPSRVGFFNRAVHALKYQGCLGLTDFICCDNISMSNRLLLNGMLKLSRIPRQNIVTRAQYIRELKEAGFRKIKIHDISEQVMLGFNHWWKHYLLAHKQQGLILREGIKYRVTSGFLDRAYRHNILRYVLVTAEAN